MPYPRIAIVGAGPAGLTLARILMKRSILPTVFERDPTPNYRPQGGTLDIHEHSGQQAIRDAGLWDEFRKHARYDGQEFKVVTKTGRVLGHNPALKEGDKGTRPEIDRSILRSMFLKAVGSGVVRWDHGLSSIQPGETNKFDLHFKSGKVETGFDLVVGADGTWSRVRPLLTPVVPFYSGTCFIEVMIGNPVGGVYDGVNNLVRRGSFVMTSDGKAIAGQRLGDNSIRVYAMFSTATDDPEWAQRYVNQTTGPSAGREALLSHFEGWDEGVRDLIKLADGELVPRPLYMFPVGHRWETKPGLTLIGDAGHVMTPFSGEGVNMAMWDSLELAKAIATGAEKGDLHGEVRKSELKMFERMQGAAQAAEMGRKVTLAQDIDESWKQVMERAEVGSV